MSKKRNSRSSMETCFQILQLKFGQKLPHRCIALTLNINPSTVFEVLSRFNATLLAWPLPESVTPDALEKLIFPPKDASHRGSEAPDWLYIDTEIRRPHVTRQLLWTEYKAQFDMHVLGYSQFCRSYR